MAKRASMMGLVAALLLGPWALSGQTIRGRLSESGPQETPLAAAYVTLRGAAGQILASTLTDASGWFTFTAPGPGRYDVQAEYVGYLPARDSVTALVEEVAWVELTTSFQAIELEGLVAEVDRECTVGGAAAVTVARLWDEVRKALRVAVFIEQGGTVRFATDTWTRRLDPERLRVVSEDRRNRSGVFAGSPFVSLPPDELAEGGYIQSDEGSDDLHYYAPDAGVLLHRSFQDAHCFGLVVEAPEPGWVGLTFRPRDDRAADVEGTLWIDRSTYEPRRLDYRYPVLPWKVVTDQVGGRLEFSRLPEGFWIVRRWRLRMPVVTQNRFRVGGSTRTRFAVAALVEEGGEVVEVRGKEGVFAFEVGTLTGQVRDSVTGAPVADAEVRVAGTILRTRSDVDGHFRLDQVPEGRYRLEALTQEWAELGVEPPGVDVDVRNGRETEVDVRLPSAFLALAATCDAPLTDHGEALLVGTVLDSAGGPVAGAQLEISYQTVRSFSRNRGGVAIGARDFAAPVPLRPDGSYTLCGVPSDEEVVLQAMAPGYRAQPVVVRTLEGQPTRADPTLVPARLAAMLVVRVVGPDGSVPVDAADVTLTGLGRSAVTDASGSAAFAKVPLGVTVVRIQHLAYLGRTDTLDVVDDGTTYVTARLPERAIDLEPIVVEVTTPEAETRRRSGSHSSIALSQADIQRTIKAARANNVAQLMRDALPTGVRLSPLVRGSNYLGTCIESSHGNLAWHQARKPGVCRMVQVVVDGGYLSTLEAARLVETFPLTEVVSMEFLSPMEQTFRYGTQQATGMLVIRTARVPGR